MSEKKVPAPAPSIWQRLASAFRSDEMSPEMTRGLEIARREDPTIANVETYGPLSRLLMPGAQAYVGPGKGMYLNRALMEGMSPDQIADTILHEQQHVKQIDRRGNGVLGELVERLKPGLAYHERPDEIEAFQFEKNRRQREGRTQEYIPALDGRWIAPRDVHLHPEVMERAAMEAAMRAKKR